GVGREVQGTASVSRWFPGWGCGRWELVCGEAEPLGVSPTGRSVGVGMALFPEVDRADRSDAGAVDKALEGALVGDIGPCGIPGWDLFVGAGLLRHGVNTRIAAVFLALIRLAQNFSTCGCVHLRSSFSVPCSVSDAFQPRHELSKVRSVAQG